MKISVVARALSGPSLAAALLFSGGCASGPAPASVASWRDAVVAVQEQSDVVFRGVNELARDAQIERAVNLVNLKESDFEPTLDAQSLAIWHGVFDDLAAYGQALARLVDPATTAGVESSLEKLASTAAAKANSATFQKRPGLASAIGKFGSAIASAAASAEAQKIAQEADPGITELLGEMSTMIRDQEFDQEIGVAAFVNKVWTDRANEKRNEFRSAGSADAKRRLAREYAELLDQRSGADQLLRDLARSLETLAASHTGLAQDAGNDLGSLIAQLREQTKLAQSIVDELKKTEKPEP